MSELTEIASGLKFPEGPIALAGGSVLLVEMFGPRLTRVDPDGSRVTIATIPGGPNGAAIGADGAVYLCNNGGSFTEIDMGGLTFPGPFDPANYSGGRIQRLDLTTGTLTDLYSDCEGRPFRAPNDLVFDAHGGFYFTDHGIRDLIRGRPISPGSSTARPMARRLPKLSFPSRHQTASGCPRTAPCSTGPRPTLAGSSAAVCSLQG